MFKKINPLVGILIFFLVVCFYRLDSIPGEWFGDVSIVNSYVSQIITGQWPFTFITSQGPLYYYLIAPIIYIFGVSYLNYKICSVLTGLMGIVFVYLFVKTLSNRSAGLIAAFITASSFWYLVWCRLGYNIIGPVLTAITLFLFFNYQKNKNTKFLYSVLFISCLGLINYAGTFFLPLAIITIFLVNAIFISKTSIRSIFTTLIIFFIALVPMVIILSQNLDSLSPGYMGEKLFQTKQYSTSENINRLATNLRRTLGMFHFEGDVVFRWNVSKSPHLDIVSGIFLIIGLICSLIKKKATTLLLLISAFILILPSIYPGHPSAEVPSSPRTQAIIPIIIYLTSFGVYYLTEFTKKLYPSATKILLFLILSSISFLNLTKYFIDYPKGLPNDNTPFGKIIAQDIDKLPPGVDVYLADIGWGDWEQPEPDGIFYAINNNKGRENILSGTISDCSQINQLKNSYIISNPLSETKLEIFQQCFSQIETETHTVNNQLVYKSLFIKSNPD
ncbi:MAG: glycosyltransferase family 39 protein [Candidatus Shapirobacteria bacterium]|jgi:4-amino-4-deoxy-L-arabinose transferase-like glycosyltransferase